MFYHAYENAGQQSWQAHSIHISIRSIMIDEQRDLASEIRKPPLARHLETKRRAIETTEFERRITKLESKNDTT